MRLTKSLCAQHLGRMFKKHWQIQGKRVPYDTGAAADLEKFGIKVKNVTDVVFPKPEVIPLEVVGLKSKPPQEDETHPNWHSDPCYIYSNENVLLEGVPQAQLLTKTIEINGLPKSIEGAINTTSIFSSVDRRVQDLILASHVFDAEQAKLSKIKIAERPAYNLPRVYGITHERRNRLLVNKLIEECEKLTGRVVTSRRRLIDNVNFSVTIPKDDNLLQFNVSAEKMITSSRPLEPVKGQFNNIMPDLHPIKCTVTIPKKNIYLTNTIFPLSKSIDCGHPHTIFSDFNKELVQNLFETSVTSTQFQSRTLLKAFTVAAARAKQLYGESAYDDLPKPICVQSIQTDGRTFHFGFFQLNTLSLSGNNGIKNYWFHKPNMDLFSVCEYKAGRPILEGYNSDVFRCIYAFYNNS